jgi:hypothetical protein
MITQEREEIRITTGRRFWLIQNLPGAIGYMTVRVVLGELVNPYLTARMFVRFVQIKRAILIPKDVNQNTVIIIDAQDTTAVSAKVKKIQADIKYEVLAQSFDEVLRQTERAIKDKKAFLIEQ